MKNVEILDCTLRDGGRLFNCEFSDEMITDVASRLQESHVDVIEVGFLRDSNIVQYQGGSTFFTELEQIDSLIGNIRKGRFVVFIDYGLYDFSNLKECKNTSISGIRFGFTHKDIENNKENVLN